MRSVIQRVKQSSVTINGKVVGAIGKGVLVLLGIAATDGKKERDWMIDKILNLRIFEDQEGKMNNSLLQHGGGALIVSQFTLYGDCRKGRRPGYSHAAPPEIAEPYYNGFIEEIRKTSIEIATGRFGADMDVALINDGPVTLLLDSDKTF